MVGEAYHRGRSRPGRHARRASPRPRRVVTARAPEAVPAALAALDAALAGGAWVAGYASLRARLRASRPRLAPLMPPGRGGCRSLDFGVFPAGPGPALPAAPGGALGPFRPRWSRADYAAAFARVADYIRAGDIYQANLTLPLDGRWQGDPAAIARRWRARQPVGYGALVALGGDGARLALARALLRARRRRRHRGAADEGHARRATPTRRATRRLRGGARRRRRRTAPRT